MTPERTNDQVITIGRVSEALLNETEVWDWMRSDFLAVIEHSTFEQKDEREDAYRMLKAIEALQARLRKQVNDAVKLKKDQDRVTH